METITAINEIESKKEGWSSEAGYEVLTTAQRIRLVIDNDRDCCERWGWFWCNDNPQDFVGATVQGIKLTDTALNEAHMKANDLDPSAQYFEGGVMFVNIETDRGVLQFVAYNEHNGYYGHEARVESQQLQYSETL